ncbi:MAG TPA: YceI family protein [Pirellulaceae bacterium]|nr:YceI family protein [Pirellulaceae bacterium]
MRCALGWLALVCLVIAGCGEKPQSSAGPGSSGAIVTDAAAKPGAETGAATDAKTEAGTTTVQISPENTTITFVGTHAPPKAKDPRTGTFEKFSGTAEMDAANKQIKSLSVEIDTTSLKAEHEEPGKAVMLTNHLKNPDFLDVEQYPTAKFESTKIEHGPGDAHTVTGNLTLHGVTKEITFPAKVETPYIVMIFTAEFEIDRMDFGVGEGKVDQVVERPVTIKVTLGKNPG